MRKRLLTAALALGLLSSSALALTLGEAREQGRVGETLNGYLAPLIARFIVWVTALCS